MSGNARVARVTAAANAAIARVSAGYVRTPDAVAERVVTGHVDLASLPAGAYVLDAGAGDGQLTRAILDANEDVHVIAVEPDAGRADALEALAAESGRVLVYRGTLEDYARTYKGASLGEPFTLPGEQSPRLRVDAVVMNPPFSLPGRPGAWLDLVELAHGLLMPGGQLVAIVPPAYTYRVGPAFKRLRDSVTAAGGSYYDLPAGSFEESGTNTAAGVLTYPKPMRTDGRPAWVLSRPEGDPVEVTATYPLVTAWAAHHAPVQRYDVRGRSRVIRYVGTCCGCARLLWEHDTGGDGAELWALSSHLEAAGFDLTGPDIGLCLVCANNYPSTQRAEALAVAYWREHADQSDAAGTYPDRLTAGQWATVAGYDRTSGRGSRAVTFTGEVMAAPGSDGHDGGRCTVLTMRAGDGTDAVMHVEPSDRVQVHADRPAYWALQPVDTRPAAVVAADTPGHSQPDLWGELMAAHGVVPSC